MKLPKSKKTFSKNTYREDATQYLTYEADTRSENEIKDDFYSQAKILNPYVDFFYFDVLSSVRDLKLVSNVLKSLINPI